MAVEWQGIPAKYQFAVQQLANQHGEQAVAATVTVTEGSAGLTLKRAGDTGTIAYHTPADLMRGVTLWLGHAQHETAFSVAEQTSFDSVAVMLDVARNGVPTVANLKALIERTASLGYTEVWLYLEDVFEVPGEPYFGLGRGRFSQAQLHDLAVYADRFGVTLVPAIQTLAHLQNLLRWQAFDNVKDADDVLYAGKAETRAFLKRMLTAASAPFLTKKIHIGMDEAYNLGRGKRLDDGYVDQQQLIQDHLKMVVELTQELGLTPYMWSDMWFTIASPTHTMYDESVHFTPEFVASLPHVGQVFWDYYHDEPEIYKVRLKQHKELKQPLVWAGGVWTWAGLAPDQSKMLASIKAGMTGAKAEGIKEVVATMWFDDGAETPLSASWLGLQDFIEYQYHDTVSPTELADAFSLMQGEDAASYLLLDDFDNLRPGTVNTDADNPSKLVLYEDLLLQRYRQNLAPEHLAEHYEALATKLTKVTVSANSAQTFKFYQQLAKTLAAKVKALDALAALTPQARANTGAAVAALSTLKAELQRLITEFRALWHAERRGEGYEVLDIRLGGLVARVDTVLWRLDRFAAGADDLAELFEVKLPMDKWTNGPVGHGLYKQIVSPSDVLH